MGSSGILTGSQCGDEIDSYDFVFRFNMAAMKGFEEDVGSKTSYMTFNPSVIRLKEYSEVMATLSMVAFSRVNHHHHVTVLIDSGLR